MKITSDITGFTQRLSRRFLWKPTKITMIPVLMVAFLLPLGWIFPVSYGWENGPVEWAQVVVLFMGFIVCILNSVYGVGEPVDRSLWRWLSPIWLLLIGRELSWGRVLYPPLRINATGPEFLSRHEIWYGKYIYPVVACVVLVILVGMVHKRLDDVAVHWAKHVRFPMVDMSIMIFSAILSTAMEKKLFGSMDMHYMVFEELAEFIVYTSMVSIAAIWGTCKEYYPGPMRNDPNILTTKGM